MYVDYVLNGQAFGDVGEYLQGCRFDPGLLRPYVDEAGRKCVTVNTGRTRYNRDTQRREPIYEKALISDMMNNGIQIPVANALMLRKDEWKMLDMVVLKEARKRLRAWGDLAAANTFGGFNGMTKMVLEHETMSDPGFAQVDMDGLSQGRTDAPKFQLEGLPLPITHCDFFYSSRKLAVSRSGGTPLDVTMAEVAGRRVAEQIEQTLIGNITGMVYGDGTGIYGRNSGAAPKVYGYTNFPDRNTKTDLTTPTGSNPESILSDVLEMRDLLYGDNFFGPFMLYHSTPYDVFLDDDYYRTGSSSTVQTVRERLRQIDGIQDVRRLDYLSTGYVMIMVQLTPDVARAVNGMDITTVQWESSGGMRLNFKVMAIQVPQLRADFSGRCGIVHATTS